jgi:hypothetical protein
VSHVCSYPVSLVLWRAPSAFLSLPRLDVLGSPASGKSCPSAWRNGGSPRSGIARGASRPANGGGGGQSFDCHASPDGSPRSPRRWLHRIEVGKIIRPHDPRSSSELQPGCLMQSNSSKSPSSAPCRALLSPCASSSVPFPFPTFSICRQINNHSPHTQRWGGRFYRHPELSTSIFKVYSPSLTLPVPGLGLVLPVL